MCNLSEGVYNRGVEYGREEGLREGRAEREALKSENDAMKAESEAMKAENAMLLARLAKYEKV